MLAVAKMFRYHERIALALLIREPSCEVAVTLWNTAKMFRYHYCIRRPRIPEALENKGIYSVVCASSDRLLRESGTY